MKNDNYSYSFTTNKPAAEVYELLLDVRKWWTGLFEESFTGESQKPGDEFTFSAGGGMHHSTQRLIEAIPGKQISWLVTDSQLDFLNNPSEWNGSKIHFALSQEGSMTTVTFTHEGLLPEIECYDNCSSAWTGYLEKLKASVNG